MSRNTEATDDVKSWTGGPLNYKEGFLPSYKPMSWPKALMKRWYARFPLVVMNRSGCSNFVSTPLRPAGDGGAALAESALR